MRLIERTIVLLLIGTALGAQVTAVRSHVGPSGSDCSDSQVSFGLSSADIPAVSFLRDRPRQSAQHRTLSELVAVPYAEQTQLAELGSASERFFCSQARSDNLFTLHILLTI